MVANGAPQMTGFSKFFARAQAHSAHGAPAQSTRFVIPFVRRNSELPLAQSTRVLKALSCERKSLRRRQGRRRGMPWPDRSHSVRQHLPLGQHAHARCSVERAGNLHRIEPGDLLERQQRDCFRKRAPRPGRRSGRRRDHRSLWYVDYRGIHNHSNRLGHRPG